MMPACSGEQAAAQEEDAMVAKECELVNKEQVRPDDWLLTLVGPEIAAASRPGQFVHVRVPRTFDPLLRRPISIMLAEKSRGELRLLVRVAGRGTQILTATPVGDRLELLGPLGTPFPMPEDQGDVLLVAGGIGVAPLIMLADSLRGYEPPPYVRGFFGAADEDALLCWTEFASRCDEFYATTEDGGAGEQGLITDVLADHLQPGQAQAVYACGPVAMMATVAEMCGQTALPCYCSLEQRMGCGVGACLGCAVQAAGGGYLRVCKDGPVFSADALDWEAILSERQ